MAFCRAPGDEGVSLNLLKNTATRYDMKFGLKKSGLGS